MYTLHADRVVREDGAIIPLDPANTDYAQYLEWVAQGNTPDAPPPPDPRLALKAAATAKRWGVETGAITLPNGVRVGTGKADQDRITSVIANAALAGVTSVDFKAQSGWVTLTIAEVQAVAAAVALHVQACFSAERAHHEAIDALPEAALADYDVNTGWPGG